MREVRVFESLKVLFSQIHKSNVLAIKKVRTSGIYFPELASHQACNRLRRWIIRCTELHDKLLETGYRPEQRIFTPRQIGLIIHYLGEP